MAMAFLALFSGSVSPNRCRIPLTMGSTVADRALAAGMARDKAMLVENKPMMILLTLEAFIQDA